MRFVIFTLRKSWLAIFSRNLHDCILPHCNLDIFPTGKRVSHRGKYEIEIPANFNFYGPKKAIKLAKKQNEDERKLKGNCETLSKVNIKCPVLGSVCYREVCSRG